MPKSNEIVQKLWNYCQVLRDVGLSYQDYLEQLTYLLFMKMAQELTEPPLQRDPIIPDGLDWPSLLARDGAELELHYRLILSELGRQPGTLGVIYRKAENKIQDPALLRRLVVNLIEQESWMSLDTDVKGDAYEGLLQRNAEDIKSGAGQYFTPRPLIQAIVDVVRPDLGTSICDPACGTGGFILGAYEFMVREHGSTMNPDQKRYLKFKAFRGWEIVANTARLCQMNMLLHGIGAPEAESFIAVDDALRSDPGDRYDIVLTNPPFGRKSSIQMVTADGTAEPEDTTVVRDDFWATTKNKQLNFVQHVKTILKVGGRCAIVVPDNVLFEGGAGETVRRKLLHAFDVHTLLRLPGSIFYAQGVKANVLFFDKKPASESPWTKQLWIYDYRTNIHHTLKAKPLRYEHLSEFVEAYKPDQIHARTESERFRSFTYEELIARDKASLDIFWLRDETLEEGAQLPDPGFLAQEIADDLEAALAELSEVVASVLTERSNAEGGY